MNITLRQLRYVVTASQKQSILGAANALNISTSSILMAVDKFEQEFGIQVFVRQRSKGLVTTAAGERVIARTIRMLDEADAYVSDISGGDKALSGELRVGSFTSITPKIAPLVIRELRAAHPGLIVHLSEGDIIAIQQGLRDGVVDILLPMTPDCGKNSIPSFSPMRRLMSCCRKPIRWPQRTGFPSRTSPTGHCCC